MMNKLRRIFKPTKEEEIEDFETLLKFHNDYIGECSTCSNHIPSSYPGFVTDCGECKKNMKHFTEKVFGLRKIDCDEYTEDLDVVNSINKEIERRKI